MVRLRVKGLHESSRLIQTRCLVCLLYTSKYVGTFVMVLYIFRGIRGGNMKVPYVSHG